VPTIYLHSVFPYLTKSILFIFDDNREVVVAIEDMAAIVKLKVADRPMTLKQIFLCQDCQICIREMERKTDRKDR
jgi:hypothetical protein